MEKRYLNDEPVGPERCSDLAVYVHRDRYVSHLSPADSITKLPRRALAIRVLPRRVWSVHPLAKAAIRLYLEDSTSANRPTPSPLITVRA